MLRTLRRISRFWRPHRWLAAGLAVLMLLEVGFTVALAIALKWIVDAVVDGGAGSAAPVIILLVAALVVSGVAAVARGKLSAAATATHANVTAVLLRIDLIPSTVSTTSADAQGPTSQDAPGPPIGSCG